MLENKGDLSLFSGRQEFEDYKRNSGDSYARALAKGINNTTINVDTPANDRLNSTIVKPGSLFPTATNAEGDVMDTAEQTRLVANFNKDAIAQKLAEAKTIMSVNRSDNNTQEQPDVNMDSGLGTQ